MKMNMWKIRVVCLTLLMMVFALTGCKTEEKQEQVTSNPEVVDDGNTNANKEVIEVGVTEDDTKVYPKGSVRFETEHSYSKLLKLFVELPEGVKAVDISNVSFQLDTEMPLELRLYAGAKDVQKSASNEVTGSRLEALTVEKDSNKVTVDGVEVEQKNYDISFETKDSTRAYLVEGEGQKVSFTFEGAGKDYLATIDGDMVVFGLYANNVAPRYTIYSLSIQAGGQTYEFPLDETTVKTSQGCSVFFH